MQGVQTNSENAAREAWEALIQRYPRLYRFLSIISSALGFFVNGHAVVAFAQWLVKVAGRIAQSALLLATLYVTINNVAHAFVALLLPAGVVSMLNQLSVIAFSIIPELIVASAIQATYEHCAMFFRRPGWKNSAWVWAILYALPTGAFVIITYVTLSSFVSAVAISGVAPIATGVALTFRFLVGWSYSLVEILFATIGKRGYVAMLDNLRAINSELRNVIALRDSDIQKLRAALALRDNELRELREQVATQADELIALRSTQEKRTRIQALRKIAPAQIDSATDSATGSNTPSATNSAAQDDSATLSATRSATDNGYVAMDNGDSIAISNGNGATIIATGEPRERIKQAMLQALRNGEKPNYKEIAEIAQAGYSTVRKHAQAIIEEISQELPEMALPAQAGEQERSTDHVPVVRATR